MSTETITPSLVFNIPEQSLKGKIDAVPIDCHAVSGGRAGSTNPDAVRPTLANNVYATAVHKGSETGGIYGPLPLGLYRMKKHPNHQHWVWLDPLDNSKMFGRYGMRIHPRGPIGSIGCIVPDTVGDVNKILHGIELCKQKGAADPILSVVAISANLDTFRV